MKVGSNVIKVSVLLLALILCSLLFSSWVIRWAGPIFAPNALFSFDCDEKLVALTIDDGPDPKATAEILDVLATFEAKAAFFVIGNRAEDNFTVIESIVSQGHEIANHTFTDNPTSTLSPKEQRKSVSATHQLLSQHAAIKWFRPGSGWYNDATLKAIKPFDYEVALADIYPLDHAIYLSQFHVQYIKWVVRPGSIILLHDGKERGKRTASSLQKVLPWLSSQGYDVLTLSELANHASCRRRK